MRSDVNKVLTECYKVGCKFGAPKFPRHVTNEIFDETGGKIGMRYEHVRAKKHVTKSFGENLGYLRGFVHSSIGRNWDEVYSEIVRVLDRRSTTQEHIFQHLFDYITVKTIRIDGEIYKRSSWGESLLPISGIYVDPETKIIMPAPVRVKEKTYWQLIREEKLARKKVLNSFCEMHQAENGLWYTYSIKPIPETIISYEFDEIEPDFRIDDHKTWSEWFKKKKAFEKLLLEDKKRLGRKVFVRLEFTSFNDEILSENMSKLTTGYWSGVGQRRKLWTEKTHYYADKRSASKKELRAVGL